MRDAKKGLPDFGTKILPYWDKSEALGAAEARAVKAEARLSGILSAMQKYENDANALPEETSAPAFIDWATGRIQKLEAALAKACEFTTKHTGVCPNDTCDYISDLCVEGCGKEDCDFDACAPACWKKYFLKEADDDQ